MDARAAQGYLIDLVPLSDRGHRAGQMYKRFPRNLGGTVKSILSVRWGLRDNNSRLSKASSQRWRERNNENKDGTAKRRKRSVVGCDNSSRSAVIVPMKEENSPERIL